MNLTVDEVLILLLAVFGVIGSGASGGEFLSAEATGVFHSVVAEDSQDCFAVAPHQFEVCPRKTLTLRVIGFDFGVRFKVFQQVNEFVEGHRKANAIQTRITSNVHRIKSDLLDSMLTKLPEILASDVRIL